MQDNLHKDELNKEAVPLKPNADNLSYSTEHSEVNALPIDTYDESNLKPKTKPVTMTPNVNVNRRDKDIDAFDSQGRLYGSEKRVEWNKPDYDVVSGMQRIDNSKTTGQFTVVDEPSTVEVVADKLDNVAETLRDSMNVAENTIADATLDLASQAKTKLNEVRANVNETVSDLTDVANAKIEEVKESFVDLKDKAEDCFDNVANKAAENLELVKDKTVDALGLNKPTEPQIPDLAEKYAKLDEIKFSGKYDDETKIEKALDELDSIPLDPSHARDELITESKPVATHHLSSHSSPFDALETGMVRHEEGRAIRREKTFDASKIDEAIAELETIPLDPSHVRDTQPHDPSQYDTELLKRSEPVDEDAKLDDPEYKRAEAVGHIIEDMSPEYAKYCAVKAEERRLAAQKKEEEGILGAMKHKLADAVTSVQHMTSEVWEKTKEAMPDMTVMKEGMTDLWEKTKDSVQVAEQKIEAGLDSVSNQIVRDFAREAHHPDAPVATTTTTTVGTSTTAPTTLPFDSTSRTDEFLTKVQDAELTEPLLQAEQRENVSDIIYSNLEVNKQGDEVKQSNFTPKVDNIMPKELKADAHMPDQEDSFKYAEFGDEQASPVGSIPKNGGLLVNTDTKMVNNLKGLKDPHVEDQF